MARQSRNTAVRDLGKDVGNEFSHLSLRSDSLVHALTPTGARKKGSTEPRVRLGSNDAQLVRHLESSITSTLEQLDDARVEGRGLEINLLLDSGRSALRRILDKARLTRQKVTRGRTP